VRRSPPIRQTRTALDRPTEGFVSISECEPPDPTAAAQAVRTNLFQQAQAVELRVPSHRSGRSTWRRARLARTSTTPACLVAYSEPPDGSDGRACLLACEVSYAWLSTLQPESPRRLIDADP